MNRSRALSAPEVATLTSARCLLCNKDMISHEKLYEHMETDHTNYLPEHRYNNRAIDSLPENMSKQTIKGRKEKPEKVSVLKKRCTFGDCNSLLDSTCVVCFKCHKAFCLKHALVPNDDSSNSRANQWGGSLPICCECFNYDGTSRNCTDLYLQFRGAHIEANNLILNKLEARLCRLILELSQLQRDVGIFSNRDLMKRREIEESVVPWEDERPIERCRLCGQRFTYFFRKHHCRLCGRVTCGDSDRECSREVQLSLLAEKLNIPRVETKSTYPLRMCIECRNILFRKRNYEIETRAPPSPVLMMLKTLKRYEAQVNALLPDFQERVAQLAVNGKNPAFLNETRKIRSQLLRSFSNYDNTARKLSDLSSTTDTEERLKKQIYSAATGFLREQMLSLQSLPEILHTDQPLVPKTEVTHLQEKFVILEEQRYIVQDMLLKAKNKRRFDEVAPLETSYNDLTKEIDRLRQLLGKQAPQ